MAVYRRSSRSRFTLLVLILTSVTVLTLDQRGDGDRMLDVVKSAARDAFAPVQDATSSVLEPVGDFVSGVTNYGNLREENARLRDEIETLQGERAKAQSAELQARKLAEQANLPFIGDIPAVRARVVSSSASNFELTVEIGRGRNDGVAPGMPVVTGAGLAGRVVRATRTRATVLLLTDPTFDVGVRVLTTGDVGVASGRGREKPLRVDLIDPATPLEKGAILETSGLQQSRYPPGIPVGTVIEAAVRPGRLQQDVRLRPVADLRRIDLVTVLQWHPA